MRAKTPVVLLLSLAFSIRALAEESDDAHARAVRLAAEGAAAYKAERYVDALAKFGAAWRTFPAPPLLLNISRSNLKLGRCNDAIRYAEQYKIAVGDSLGVSPDSPDDWLSVVHRSCIDARIESNPTGAAIWIDGERQSAPESTPWSGRLTVGHHKILLWKDDQRTEASLDVAADAPGYVAVTLMPTRVSSHPALLSATPSHGSPAATSGSVTSGESPKLHGLRWEPFIPGGVAVVGIALAIAGGVSGQQQCPTHVGAVIDVAPAEQCQNAYATLADVGWGVAGAGAVISVVLGLVLNLKPNEQYQSEPIHVGLLGNGVFVAGTF